MKHQINVGVQLLLAAILSSSSFWAQADNGYFYRTGRLVDTATNTPVEGERTATVRFYDSKDAVLSEAFVTQQLTLSFEDGRFALKLSYDDELMAYFRVVSLPYFGLQIGDDEELRPLSIIAQPPVTALAHDLVGELRVGGRLIVDDSGQFPDDVQSELQGPVGPAGETGEAGATGSEGPAGKTGETGATGPVGPSGPRGPVGPPGPRGPVGQTGAAGANGGQGEKGDPGPPGTNGTNGDDGADGQSCTLGSCKGAFPAPGTTTLQCGADSVSMPCDTGKYAFVTSTKTGGNIGGLTGADQLCQSSANAANLNGIYMAWLSDASVSTSDRFLTKSSSPYYLVDGTEIASSWQDLTDGSLTNPIIMDEFGNNLACPYCGVWTGTSTTGEATSTGNTIGTCDDWTSSGGQNFYGDSGQANESDFRWTGGSQYTCDAVFSLYCFQQ